MSPVPSSLSVPPLVGVAACPPSRAPATPVVAISAASATASTATAANEAARAATAAWAPVQGRGSRRVPGHALSPVVDARILLHARNPSQADGYLTAAPVHLLARRGARRAHGEVRMDMLTCLRAESTPTRVRYSRPCSLLECSQRRSRRSAREGTRSTRTRSGTSRRSCAPAVPTARSCAAPRARACCSRRPSAAAHSRPISPPPAGSRSWPTAAPSRPPTPPRSPRTRPRPAPSVYR